MPKASEIIKEAKKQEEENEPKVDLSEYLARPIDVSIIMPVITNTKELAEMTLKSVATIANTTRDKSIELIIIDNGSTLPIYLRPDVHIRNPINIGYGPAVNQGIKIARGKYVVPMNNDVFLQDGWLEPLLKAMEEDETLGVIRPIAVGESSYGTENDKRKFGEKAVVIDQKDYHGFCYMIRKSILDELKEDGHYFDERYAPAYCEDMDMWVRLTKAGYKMARHTDSHVQHLGGVTAGAIAPSGEVDLNSNRLKFFEKWGFDVFTPDWYTEHTQLTQKFGSIDSLKEKESHADAS